MEKYDHNSNYCRICFENEVNNIFIFSDEAKKLHLQAKIRKYLYITITSEDNFSKIICNKCVKILNWIHKFATMAVQTQDKFNKSLSNKIERELNDVDFHQSLLHTFVSQEGMHKDDLETESDADTTEMEIRIDPMLILQYRDDSRSSSQSENENSSSSDKNGISKDGNNGDKSYQCNRCSKEFVTEFTLQGFCGKDMDIKDSSPFSCPVCGKIFSSRDLLKNHLETHQSKGKYGCDICGRIFKTETNLYRHKEYHEGLQHPCQVCGRVYPTNSTLRAHSITHSNIRPHKCHVCDKSFKRNQDLKFHMNQHTGERPYQCPYCPKAFASSGNCFSHRKRMHPGEVERDKERALLL